MRGEDLKVGDRVTYTTDFPGSPPEIGTIATPTDDEIRYAATVYAAQASGPDHGDVLVKWDGDEWDRSWEKPADLARF